MNPFLRQVLERRERERAEEDLAAAALGFETEDAAAPDAPAEQREFFGDGYSFRRLGKMEDLDPALVARLRCRRWKLANPERCRELKRESLARLKVLDPEGQRAMRRRRKKKWQGKNPEKVKAMGRRAYAKKAKDPAFRAAAAARVAEWQRAAMADPVKAEALRKRKREWAQKQAALKRALEAA